MLVQEYKAIQERLGKQNQLLNQDLKSLPACSTRTVQEAAQAVERAVRSLAVVPLPNNMTFRIRNHQRDTQYLTFDAGELKFADLVQGAETSCQKWVLTISNTGNWYTLRTAVDETYLRATDANALECASRDPDDLRNRFELNKHKPGDFNCDIYFMIPAVVAKLVSCEIQSAKPQLVAGTQRTPAEMMHFERI